MKVSGFTFIRNAIKYDYPIVEAIRSILPICDDFIVAVGKSDDQTLDLIRQIDPSKITILETVWDDSLREGGRVLAVETNKAFDAVPSDSDWAFYIQGDEVVHEQYLETIRSAMQLHLNNPTIEGLLFKYLHFYGSYDYVGSSYRWYRNEIRVIRNDKRIRSFRDAQGFRKENRKLIVAPVDAYVYHYGWVKEPSAMQQKQETFHKLWHDDRWVEKNVYKTPEYDYKKNIDQLERFHGTHPAVMRERIDRINWTFEYDISFNKKTFKQQVKEFFERVFGIEIGYKNYKIYRKWF
ncbi:MAG TPA: hypothetical protein PK990_05040 [Salinivirgaceae bacterium]|nr:hypothetical protein [Salinivirgaceae bacterium]